MIFYILIFIIGMLLSGSLFFQILALLTLLYASTPFPLGSNTLTQGQLFCLCYGIGVVVGFLGG